MAEGYWRSRTRYVEEGLLAAKLALQKDDYRRAEILLLTKINPLYEEANTNCSQLLEYLSERAKTDFTQVADRNQGIATIAVAGILIGCAVVVLAGMYFFRATVMPLQKAVSALEDIAEGNLARN